MIEVIDHGEELGKTYRTYEVRVPYADLININLDPFDRAVLKEEAKTAADVLQDLQILAFRQQQRHEATDAQG